ncbi:hypothetical protein [Pseudonocardia zijingensis]|jgi:hypothetical protein|uniref:Uncharacterized protein n=1 Tax=Pseudonocardia zijingensis TaxID=153376 RepID=A0ABN1NGP4_9PSEU
MAGSVDLLQRCFAGLETRQDALWFKLRPGETARFLAAGLRLR